MSGILTGAKDAIDAIWFTWVSMLSHGPRHFFQELEKQNRDSDVVVTGHAIATHGTFFFSVLAVYQVLVTVTYYIKKTFIPRHIATQFNLGQIDFGPEQAAAYQAVLACLFLVAQSFILYLLVRVLLWFANRSHTISFHTLLKTKAYLYAYAIVPYVISFIYIVIIAKLFNPDVVSVSLLSNTFSIVLLVAFTGLTVVDARAASYVSKTNWLLLLALYLPSSAALWLVAIMLRLY